MMRKKEKPDWSDSLKGQTRSALEDCLVNPLTACIHLKSRNGAFGRIELNDAISRQYRITDEQGHLLARFDDVESLIKAGWVID